MIDTVWDTFFERIQATKAQQEQFKQYYALLQEYNEIHSLTAITDFKKVLEDHFEDSLALGLFVDCSKIQTLADVGSGAGFPGLPLKIMYPHLRVILIEVNQKKVSFLRTVVEKLGLEVVVVDLDWRTFLRQCDEHVDIFCARASLQVEELVRVFMPSSCYKHAVLVYWASEKWKPNEKLGKFIEKEARYSIGDKKRKLIFFRSYPSNRPAASLRTNGRGKHFVE